MVQIEEIKQGRTHTRRMHSLTPPPPLQKQCLKRGESAPLLASLSSLHPGYKKAKNLDNKSHFCPFSPLFLKVWGKHQPSNYGGYKAPPPLNKEKVEYSSEEL